MIRINHVEVHFEVDGSDDDATFSRMFRRHIDEWQRTYQEQQERARLAERERGLGDGNGEDRAW